MELNGLDSWKVVLYLLPVALAMLWVRRREAALGVTQFHQLTVGQKAWILLVALPPGAAALLMGQLSEAEVRGYVQAGAEIRGSGQNLVPGVVRQFTAMLPGDWTRGAGRDLDELLALLTRRAQSDAWQMVGILIEKWPPPPVVQPPVAAPEAEPAEEATEEPAESPAAPADVPPPTPPPEPAAAPGRDDPLPRDPDPDAEEPPAPQGEERPPDVHA